MSKDALWFTHDSNARHDPKVRALRAKYGISGYGAWWVIVEMLRDCDGYMLPKKPYVYAAIADECQMEATDVERLLNDCSTSFELLEEDDSFFWSASLTRRMESLDAKRKQTSEAGKKSAESRKNGTSATDVERPLNDRSTTVELYKKDIQGKEEREKREKLLPEPDGSVTADAVTHDLPFEDPPEVPEAPEVSAPEAPEEPNAVEEPEVVEEPVVVRDPAYLPWVREVVEEWNRVMPHPPFPAVTKVTDQRREHLGVRFRDPIFREKFRDVFQRARASPFLSGENERTWVVSFDWLIKNNENYIKVLEGKYDRRNGKHHSGANGTSVSPDPEYIKALTAIPDLERRRRKAAELGVPWNLVSG